MRILVTGGAGFIGSHLSETLLHKGHEVRALDDLSTGRLENLATFDQHPRFRFIEGNVMDAALVNGLVAESDQIFHLAAAVGVKYVLENPLRSLITNIRGTEVVLEAADRHHRKIMLFSSSEVYGKGASVPFSEDDDRVMGPTHKLRWSYACGKSVDECLAQAYYQQRQLPVVVVRGAILLSESRAAEGDVFNVGTAEEITIRALAGRIKRLCNSSSVITFVRYEQVYGHSFEDMRRRVPDLTKIGRVVGYQPSVSLDQLLELTVRDTCERMSIPCPVGLATA